MSEMKALVTGGAGFIGSMLVRKLLEKDYQVTVFDNLSIGSRANLPHSKNLQLISGDVRDFELLSTVIHGHPYVMHLAAQAFIPLSYQLPLQVAGVNAIGSINLFKACLNHGVKRVIHVSSSEVYGSAKYEPMDEQHPLCPMSTYAISKAAADMWAQAFYWEHKLPVVIIRPFNAYGPRESLPYFIPEIIRQCLKEPVVHVGNLETSRDFTYVEDTAEAITTALETESIEGEIINIGTNKTWQMKEVLDIVLKKVGMNRKKNVLMDKERFRPLDVEKLIADNTKARKLLGWKPLTSFESGLEKVISWYVNNGKAWGYEHHEWQWRY